MEGRIREQKQLSCIRSLLHAWTTITSGRKNLIMFDEGGCVVWCVVWCGVEARSVSRRGQSDSVRFVVSCDHESGSCMCLCLRFFNVYS